MRDYLIAVHRFWDSVALSVGGGTIYLTPKDARRLTRAINRACRSVEREPFIESKNLTVEFRATDWRFVP